MAESKRLFELVRIETADGLFLQGSLSMACFQSSKMAKMIRRSSELESLEGVNISLQAEPCAESN